MNSEESGSAEAAACKGAGNGEWTSRHVPWPAGLLRNLRAGVKAAIFLRVPEEEILATPGALAALCLLDATINLITSFLLSGPGSSFSYSSISSFFFHLPLMLFYGLVAGKLLSRQCLTLALPVALISIAIPVEGAHYALEGLARLAPLHRLQDYLEASNYYRFFWWWAAAGALFTARLAGGRLARTVELPLLFLAMVATPLWFFPRGDLWATPTTAESGEVHLTEEVLDVQAHLLDQQLAALLPGDGGPHLYFVGFAGDATQDVFLKEITAAQRLLDSRFGSAGRSVVLANNPRTATTLPFATVTNLDRTLKGVARAMNRKEDVLVLFLTSHGSEDHVLTVDNGALELDGLTPETLGRLLKRSGIVWKILVVSACYSGGFIEPLKDDHTLIMTAADATHASFGCGYGENFTWFGQALLQDGLRETYSVEDAFLKARDTVRKWEQDQGETPSNPQIFVGKEMEGKVREVERKLEGQPALHAVK